MAARKRAATRSATTAREARVVAELLAHIDRRVREFDRRLAILEDARPVDGDSTDAATLATARAAVEALHGEIRRPRAASSLLALHLQVRREQLATARGGLGSTTTMEAS